jgi:hypothetical protein
VIALALALALSAGAPSDAPATALGRGAAQAAAQALEDVPQGRTVGVFCQAPTPELQQAGAALLVDSVRKRGAKAALIVDAQDPQDAERQGRSQGIDVLLRVRVGLEGGMLTLGGDRVGTWVNFWDGKTLIRQLPGSPLSVQLPADASVLTLARVVVPTVADPVVVPEPPRFAVTELFRIPARVLAMALVDLDGEGQRALAVLTPGEVLILGPHGEVRARRDFGSLPRSAHPVREPCGGLTCSSGGRGRSLQSFACSQSRGETLSLDGSGLHPVGLLDATPLASGTAGSVSAINQAGTNLFGPEVKLGAAPHTLARAVVALAANPGPGEPSFLASYADGEVQPLSRTLGDLGAPLPGAGIAALADLDGDGIPELILSSGVGAPESDSLRILAPGSVAPRFLSAPLNGAIAASAAGDLDGSGHTVGLFALRQADGQTLLLRVGLAP